MHLGVVIRMRNSQWNVSGNEVHCFQNWPIQIIHTCIPGPFLTSCSLGWKCCWWQPSNLNVEDDRASITSITQIITLRNFGQQTAHSPKTLMSEKKVASFFFSHNIFQYMSYHNLIYQNTPEYPVSLFAIVIEPLSSSSAYDYMEWR